MEATSSWYYISAIFMSVVEDLKKAEQNFVRRTFRIGPRAGSLAEISLAQLKEVGSKEITA